MPRFLFPLALIWLTVPMAAAVAEAPPPPTAPEKSSAVSKPGAPGQGMSLPDVLTHVYNNSPQLQAAKAGLHAVHELYPQALAGRRPTVTTQASIYSTDVESSNFGRGDGATTKEFSANIEQPLYTSGRTDAQVDRANALIKASYATFLQGEQDLFYETARAYMDVIRDRQIVGLSQQNEEILNAELKAVSERFDGGDLTRTDVEQTRARLARAQADRVSAQSNLEQSYAAFQAVTGFAASGALLYPVPAFSFPPGLADMVRMAEEKNQVLSEARHQLEAAEGEVDAAFSELLPQLKAFASYQKEYDSQPGIIDESQVETIGLRATLTLYQGGTTQSRVREAKSRAPQNRFKILETQQDIKAQVLESWKTLKMSEQEMAARQSEIDAAKRARDGVREEARMGERSTLDTLDADQEVIGAETSYINARYAATLASFALARSLGLMSPEGIGLGGIAYDPGHHYHDTGDKWFSLDPE